MISAKGNHKNKVSSGCRVAGRSLFLALCALLVVVSCAMPSAAQITSTIEGTITDQQGLVVPGAEVHVISQELAVNRAATADQSGQFHVAGLHAGVYQIEVAKPGFETKVLQKLEITVNQTVTTNIMLSVGTVRSEVDVTGSAPLLEATTTATGATITPKQIESMPINGRNYLDLLQLVPGVTLNRQADESSDAAVPILGQRGNNTQFLIDGMPNSDAVNGGAAAQFNQDSILEFQALTSSYKAEFGYGSGGVINVISKSGTNNWHGTASTFYRSSKLDSSDIKGQPDPPFLNRWDPSVQIGGPVVRDKIFAFAAIERIAESRSLNFQFPPTTPPVLIQLEAPYNTHTLTNDTRMRGKLDEQWGNHRFSEQFNLTNSHVNNFLPLAAATNLPSTRYNVSTRHLMLGLTDTATIGNQNNPYLWNYYIQYRGEPSVKTSTHPGAGLANTTDNLFTSLTTGGLFGDNGQLSYGAGFSPLAIHQKYNSFGTNLAHVFGSHTLKIGVDFQHAHVDGTESTNYFNQLFGLQDDLFTYGPVNSGVYYMSVQGSDTPIRLRNSYTGMFLQDDWKVAHNLTLNLGVRWDYDSTFPNTANISPRIGASWQPFKKTVVQASYGRFYDHFRLGLARDVPDFGGANVSRVRYFSFPRLFYGNPSIISRYFNDLGRNVPCVSSNLTDAQIAQSGTTCSLNSPPTNSATLYGIDHLNSVVTPGHAPVPAGAAVNMTSVQNMTGYTPAQYLASASAAIGQNANYFTWDPFGNLSDSGTFAAYNVPITVNPGFQTPYTDTFHFGVQQQVTDTIVIKADYYHENINHILGTRETNLEFISRIPGFSNTLTPGTGNQLINSYGPWFGGFYDGVTVQVSKRLSRHFQAEASYTYAKEWDDLLNSSLVSDVQTGSGASYTALNGPSDNFKGIVPVVTDPTTGQTNASGAFVTSTGNPVPKAGAYYNGASLDYGPSDLSVPQIFLIHGIGQLPWGFELSGIFRIQCGFAYTRGSDNPPDVDGDGLYGGRDINFVRNGYRAPKFSNVDMRVAKNFSITERIKAHAYFEMFNLFNSANPAAIQSLPGQPIPFGQPLQVLPGREGQVGVRIDF